MGTLQTELGHFGIFDALDILIANRNTGEKILETLVHNTIPFWLLKSVYTFYVEISTIYVILSRKNFVNQHIIRTKGGKNMRLLNKLAIITGGSRGIGFATAEKFLKEGARVIIAASSPASAGKAVEKLKALYPHAVVDGISPNLAVWDEVRDAFRSVEEKYGPIDILVNNAGVSESTPFSSYTEELFDKVMDLNVKGLYNATRAVADGMAQRGSGVILNTSSMVSLTGQPSGLAYPASKFAVNGMTVSLARELGPKGIRVNAVAPGITETDMMKAVPKEIIDPMIARIPLRRLGQPEDIANAFAFLASEEAAYITGVVLSVDGMART
jgi:3-oxoacyl-[acyl-carrier protein] reductase/7-alpha-hydroxysteroid dehydrogenase